MSDDDKLYPTHRITFAQKRIDEKGRETLGRPVEIGAIWPRNDPEKSGGILRFNIIPKDIEQGVLFVLDNEREHQRTPEHTRGDRYEKVDRQAASRPHNRGRER